MTSRYLLDADATINYVKQYESIEGLPDVRAMMDWLILEDRVFSLAEVRREVRQKADRAAEWVRNTEMRFERTRDAWLLDITALQRQYPSIAKPNRRFNADPILLACMRDHKTNADPEITQVIVTFDTGLQSVCRHEDISAIDMPELLRRELAPIQGLLPLNRT